MARSLSSPLNLWYLDDSTLAGPVDSVLNDVTKVIPGLEAIGLEVNPSKSEIIDKPQALLGFVYVVVTRFVFRSRFFDERFYPLIDRFKGSPLAQNDRIYL